MCHQNQKHGGVGAHHFDDMDPSDERIRDPHSPQYISSYNECIIVVRIGILVRVTHGGTASVTIHVGGCLQRAVGLERVCGERGRLVEGSDFG